MCLGAAALPTSEFAFEQAGAWSDSLLNGLVFAATPSPVMIATLRYGFNQASVIELRWDNKAA